MRYCRYVDFSLYMDGAVIASTPTTEEKKWSVQFHTGRYPLKSLPTMNNPLVMKSWSPYVVGAGIGMLSWFAFASADHPLGVTTAFENSAAMTARAAVPTIEHSNELWWQRTWLHSISGLRSLAASWRGLFASALAWPCLVTVLEPASPPAVRGGAMRWSVCSGCLRERWRLLQPSRCSSQSSMASGMEANLLCRS